ncbi:hypothetical protein H0H93_007427 [Arthromyces matolae]|nr:hypothetical protein H0H93_007427 [Arthromyces matolae]
MTVYHRSPSNHHLFARQGNNKAGSFLSSVFNQDPAATSSDAAPTPADPTSSSVVSNDPATEQPTSTSAQTHQNHHDTTTSEAPAVPTTSQEPPAPSTTSTSTSPTSTTTTPTTTSTSSILSTSTTSTSSLTSTRTTAPVTLTAAAVTQTRTTAALTSATDDSAVTASPSVSAAPSSNLSTGAIVGSVAGAIAGIVIVFFFVAFILRRWRRKRNELEFNPEDFVQSPSMAQVGNSHHHDNPFDPAPPNAAFRGSIAPSISSGPNMAGQGAYAYQDSPYTDGDYATGAGAGAAATHGQQTYAYGAYDKHANDDAINGAYSSEPQVQQAYNPEVYGSYAYSTDEHPAATTDLQHAHPYSGTQFQSHYQDNAPALVAGGPAISADRGKGKAKAMSIYEDDDAYGGI